jgi:hypothetical protein
MRRGQTMPPEAATVTSRANSASQPDGPRDDAELRSFYDLASRVWHEHQADRPWLEWGFCWPPLSVRRPRCVSCRGAWPCSPAVTADQQMTSCEELARKKVNGRSSAPATDL